MASVCMGIGKWGFPKVADLEFSTLYSIHISIHALLYKYSVAKVFKWRKVGFPGPSPLAGIRKKSFTLECRLFILYTVKLVALCYTN